MGRLVVRTLMFLVGVTLFALYPALAVLGYLLAVSLWAQRPPDCCETTELVILIISRADRGDWFGVSVRAEDDLRDWTEETNSRRSYDRAVPTR